MHKNAKDITGQRFGRLVAMCDNGWRDRAGAVYWWCLCDCGEIWLVAGYNLRSRHTQSCGCLKPDRTKEVNTKHGHKRRGKRDKAYTAWQNMIQRCEDPLSPSWVWYGGQGVTVCGRWRHSFENFQSDMGNPPSGMSLDRINPYGDYEPANCRWATWTEQANNKRVNHTTTIGE